MSGILVVFVLVSALIVWAVVRDYERRHGAGRLVWRWFSGQPLDGKYRTNATWLHPATKVMHPSGHAVRWHHLPRLTRAGIRTGGTMTPLAALWGWAVSPGVTLAAVLSVFSAAAALACWLAFRAVARFRHRRMWVTPLHRALAPVLGINLAERPGSWLQVEPDRSAAVIALPAGVPNDRLKATITGAVAAKLRMEAPVAMWALEGPKPVVRFTDSPPPPRKVTLDDIRAAIDAASATTVVLGLGRGSRPVTVSLDDDSPHIALSQGPGSGKSTTARMIGAQALYKGAVLMIWDYKRISLSWARGLPGVVYCKTAAEIHAGALWLLAEIERRNEVADAGADIEGNVHANVGPRIIVIAEEMNATMNRLRAYWREVGDGNRSPAVEAIEDAAFMGRQVLVNIVFIGQKLSVRAAASGEARETMGIRVLGRYTASTWKMLVPEVPYVQSRNEPGRVQVVTGGVARETQIGNPTGHQARQLAMAGTVTPWPSPIKGMPHLTAVPVPVLGENTGPEQGGVSMTGAPVLPSGDRVRLSDAVALGILSGTLAAVQKARHRDRAGFPAPVGRDGLAHLYDPIELAAWQASRHDRLEANR